MMAICTNCLTVMMTAEQAVAMHVIVENLSTVIGQVLTNIN